MKGRIKRQEKRSSLKLPRIGLIKTGFKNANGYPQSADYFIPSGNYATYFNDVYGAKPQKIQIVFISDDPCLSCEEKYEYRDNEGKLFAFGDGEDFEVWNSDQKQYQKLTISDYPNLLEGVTKRCNSPKGWEITLTLRFVCPMIRKVAGYWQYTTKGNASTIPQIREAFDYILESNGSISGVIFDLSVKFAKSNKPGVKSRYPVVSLIANENEQNVKSLDTSFINPNKELKQ